MNPFKSPYWRGNIFTGSYVTGSPAQCFGC